MFTPAQIVELVGFAENVGFTQDGVAVVITTCPLPVLIPPVKIGFVNVPEYDDPPPPPPPPQLPTDDPPPP